MSTTKAKLKASRIALDAHKYQDAADAANEVLDKDTKNYHANIFLGLALDKLDRNEASEAAYKAAAGINENDALAWKGLVSLYEKQRGERLGAYHDVAIRLAEIYMDADDRIKCQTVIDKYTGDAKRYGSRSQLQRSLEALLPTSSLYDFLEGLLPQPGLTYAKIADIVETEEKERINTEIGRRRTRLGAKIDQVTADVKCEVLRRSPLEDLYCKIIDWTHDDEIRRKYDEKLLQRSMDALAVSPTQLKVEKRAYVQKLAEGLVILKHPFLLAWRIVLEWNDVEEIKDLDVGLLRDFVALFPDDGLAKVLRGYLESEISPFPKPTSDETAKDDDDAETISAEDRLIMMSEGMEDSPRSILSHRLMGQFYLYLDEHDSAVSLGREGLKRVTSESTLTGLSLVHASDALRTILATALVYYQAPRYHPEALSLFQTILIRNPIDTSALIGIGMIFEEQENYVEAVDFLSKALKRSSDPKIRSEAAWCKALNGESERGLRELEDCLPDLQGSDTKTKTLRSQSLYRIGMCMWTQDSSIAARKDRNGAYARFLASLQADMNFAPAYTSLGIYYADYAKDRKRARKCFQKAFELSGAEVEAAERLAKSFANSGEWDLVEVIAQRVIASGKVKPAPGSKKKAVSWPFAALGVVQLNSQQYAKSIVSFQSALRSSPADYHCWIGLGEGYQNSGRYIAATKAFEQAQKFEAAATSGADDARWFSQYMLANVKRELGEYDNAVNDYQEVLKLKPADFGVSIALLQSLVDGAWRSTELGFYGRAADGARETISVAQGIAQERSDAFNLWKAVGDACSIFSCAQSYASKFPLREVALLLESNMDIDEFELLADVDGIGKDCLKSILAEDNEIDSPISNSIRAALLSYKRAIYSCAHNTHARAVAWYNLGWMEHSAHACQIERTDPETKKQPMRFLKAAVQCFKRAIELEAGNAEFWNALGIVTTELNAKVAQHSFVRSLYLNDKNGRVWTNLGTLFLIQSDPQLARDAFTRAQSSDPDYAQAWLGHGLLATLLGDPVEARSLFTHAFEIADSSSTMVKQQYAMSMFDHLISSPSSNNSTIVLQPLFALHQLRSQMPADLAFQHLTSLLAERVGDFADAASTLEVICSRLEAEYETSESPVTLMRFAQAKADLARTQLAARDFRGAAENAETALDLSSEEGEHGKAYQRIRLSVHMTAGLAFYHQGSTDQAIDTFRTALKETHGDPDIICLLSQMLWAKGGSHERNIAREQLLGCVEKHPEHVDAILLLGVIAVLDNDLETIEAVTADLESLRTQDSLSAQDQSKVARLLTAIAVLHPGEQGQEIAELSQATTAVMLAPSQPQGWSQLAEISEETYPAEVAVLTATKAVPPRGSLEAKDLCKAYAGTNRLDDAQRAIMVAPWEAEGWQALT